MADDVHDGYLVQVGGTLGTSIQTGTWTYRGGAWTNLSNVAGPTIRVDPSLAYDSTTGTVVLFGGFTDCSAAGCFSSANDTWIFSHGAWTELVTPVAPSPRGGAALVDDPTAGGVLLFGGASSSGGSLSDTWTFVNGTWHELNPATFPAGRLAAGIVDDVASGEIVLLGGATRVGSALVYLNDTWTFSSGNWSQRSFSSAPPKSAYAWSMTYDSVDGVPVAVSRTSTSYVNNVTWEFVANNWTTTTSAGLLPPAGGQNVGMDSADGYVLDCPIASNGVITQDVGFAGGTWTVVDTGPILPSGRVWPAIAADPNNNSAILFGGYTTGHDLRDTWTFDGSSWRLLTVPGSPPARDGAAFAFDPRDGYDVLFGGLEGGPFGNDTWTFANATWTALAPSPAPPKLYGSCLVNDPDLAELVLFGGYEATGVPTNQTWTFAHGAWTNRTTALAPPARGLAACAYENDTKSIVVFGGGTLFSLATGSGHERSDTWEYEGGVWANVTPSYGPGPRDASIFHAVGANGTGGLLLQGGGENLGTSENYYAESWFWNGSGWTQIHIASPHELGAGSVFVPATNSFEGFGGYAISGSSTVLSNDTFAFDAPNLAPVALLHRGPGALNASFDADASGEGTPASINWSFGDGSNGTGSRVNHAYGSAGNYTVFVTERDAWGIVLSDHLRVQIYAPNALPTVRASALPTSGAAPLNVSFAESTAGGVAPFTIAWQFGDGLTASGANVTHEYDFAGTYAAVLTVTDSIGEAAWDNFSILVTPQVVVPPPELGLTASVSPVAGPAPLTINYNAIPQSGVPPYNVTWTFGDGRFSFNDSGTATYTTPGTYPVTVSASDSVHQTANQTWTVTVNSSSVAPGPAASPPSGFSTLQYLLVGAGVAILILGALIVLRFRPRKS